MNHLNLEEFERKIAYTFSDKNLLILALTHSSYANETKKGSHENNERLEFLGDAVLDMVVSEYMYRHFPKMPEGELTKLRAAVVCEGSLAELSRKLGVGRCLLLGKGEESTGGRSRDSILADAFEAIIGAICMDGGNISWVSWRNALKAPKATSATWTAKHICRRSFKKPVRCL